VPGALARSKIAVDGGGLVLSLGPEAGKRYGESVQRRLDALGRALGKRTEVRRS